MKREFNWKYALCIFAFFLFLILGISTIFRLHGYTFKTINTFSKDADIADIINNIISYIGITLGLFYFIFRIIIENTKEDNITKHNTYKYIDNVIDECHEIMENLFHKKIKTNDLKTTIDNLNSKSVLIQNFIEINVNKLDEKFYDANSAYATWNSFITTCNVVNISSPQYAALDFMAERDQYLETYRLFKCSIYSHL